MAQKINAQTLATMLRDDSKTVLIDVREPSEYRREHIAQAKLFPMSAFDPAEVLKAAGKDAHLCVHCAAGGRSATACEKLASAMASDPAAAGTTKLYDLVGGMSSWRAAGLPVVEDKKAPLPVIRQVHLIASTLIISGALLSRYVHPNFIFLPLFVGCGLFVSGATGFCGMATVLQLLPYNQ